MLPFFQVAPCGGFVLRDALVFTSSFSPADGSMLWAGPANSSGKVNWGSQRKGRALWEGRGSALLVWVSQLFSPLRYETKVSATANMYSVYCERYTFTLISLFCPHNIPLLDLQKNEPQGHTASKWSFRYLSSWPVFFLAYVNINVEY